MATKTIKTRIIHKHAIEADWVKATNFTPMQGELIIYDPDNTYSYSRLKIGDGVSNVNDLPFADNSLGGFDTIDAGTIIDDVSGDYGTIDAEGII